MTLLQLIVLSALISFCHCDIYFHNPRGSNNRLNETSARRKNGNRMFDSQNNNRGGYNVGDNLSSASSNENEQYRMKYFYSSPFESGTSELTLEWTNQHGCGGNEVTDEHKQNCNHVIQFMCEKDSASATGTTDSLRNGQSTETQNFTSGNNAETKVQFNKRKSDNIDLKKGIHEPFTWYDMCVTRPQNKGLFIADQQLRGLSAIYTRQNPKGERRGYECPEERDYYPYWHPNPWKDIAVLTSNVSLCDYYRKESFNSHTRWECIEFFDKARTQRRYKSAHVTNSSCTAAKGLWTELSNYLELAPTFTNAKACRAAKFVWAVPFHSATPTVSQCLVPLPEVKCEQAMWSRSNHLGYSRDGKTTSYTWNLPYFPSLETKRCVIRIRYNISTDDYDPFGTTAAQNANRNQRSPVENNPYVDVGLGGVNLQLAVNTAQHGRTFQDRSHVVLLRPRPAVLSSRARLFNLNVRGKRGSIVQVYPGVPYDFTPNRLSVTRGDLVHIQWTGSNTHNNGSPGEDGQTGDDGQGADGTDRHNFVEISEPINSFPTAMEATRLWKSVKVIWPANNKSVKDHAISLATSGYYMCEKKSVCGSESVETKAVMDDLLNGASPSFEGVVLQFTKPGTFYYMATRNNDFGVRSQKGRIIVA